MTTAKMILLGGLELVSVLLVARLWMRRKHGIATRVLWSLIILLPALGPLLYVFLSTDVDAHDYDPPDSTGDWEPGKDG